jgi:hypothetical protein
MWTSTVRSPTTTSLRPASARSASRGMTLPARRISATRMSNSSPVRSIALPSTVTCREPTSTWTSATASFSLTASGALRRSTARRRASSSRGLKGLGT